MKTDILAIVSDKFDTLRKRSLMQSTAYWAEKRGLNLRIVKDSEITAGKVDYASAAFAHRMVSLCDSGTLLKLPPEVPIVMDMAVSNPAETNVFQGRRLLVRNAFGCEVSPWKPEQQVPMLQYPLADERIGKKDRDVVIFDVKAFHTPSTHLYIASHLAELIQQFSRLGRNTTKGLKIYFTSFFDSSLYKNLFEQLVKDPQLSRIKANPWKTIENAILPPAADHDEYLKLLQRCRLLFTEHGNLADADVIHALCLGIPTITYKRGLFSDSLGFHCSIPEAVQLLEPRLKLKLHAANQCRIREEWGLQRCMAIGRVPSWKFLSMERMFLKSWDIVLDWAVNGTINEKMNKAMERGSWTGGIQADHADYFRFRALLSSYRGNY